MYGYDHVLPFIDKARDVGFEEVEISFDKIFWGNRELLIDDEVPISRKKRMAVRPQFVKVDPFGFIIPVVQDYFSYIAAGMWVHLKLEEKPQKQVVRVIDYGRLAQRMEVFNTPTIHEELGIVPGSVMMLTPHGRVFSSCISKGLVEAAQELMEPAEYNVYRMPPIQVKMPSKPVDEALTAGELDFLKGVWSGDTGKITAEEEKDKIERYLWAYFKERGRDLLKVPMLIGNTAVAKSAVVKSVVSQLDSGSAGVTGPKPSEEYGAYGFRMIDFRAAFVDKADIEGFQSLGYNDELGRNVSQSSPMRELVESTDQYLEWVRHCLAKMYERMDKAEKELSASDFATYKEKIKELAVKAKTPVLFFDEITRAPTSVLNAFTTILNEKSFLKYTMKEARLVAATNAPAGMSAQEASEDPVVQGMFHTNSTVEEDPAIADRFSPMAVLPEDVASRWFRYMKDNKRMIQVLYDFLRKDYEDGGTYYYDFKSLHEFFVDDSNLDAEDEDIRHTPFPNFRTWDFVDDYLKAQAKKAQGDSPYFDIEFIQSLVGVYGSAGRPAASTALGEYLKANGWTDSSSPVVLSQKPDQTLAAKADDIRLLIESYGFSMKFFGGDSYQINGDEIERVMFIQQDNMLQGFPFLYVTTKPTVRQLRKFVLILAKEVNPEDFSADIMAFSAHCLYWEGSKHDKKSLGFGEAGEFLPGNYSNRNGFEKVTQKAMSVNMWKSIVSGGFTYYKIGTGVQNEAPDGSSPRNVFQRPTAWGVELYIKAGGMNALLIIPTTDDKNIESADAHFFENAAGSGMQPMYFEGTTVDGASLGSEDYMFSLKEVEYEEDIDYLSSLKHGFQVNLAGGAITILPKEITDIEKIPQEEMDEYAQFFGDFYRVDTIDFAKNEVLFFLSVPNLPVPGHPWRNIEKAIARKWSNMAMTVACEKSMASSFANTFELKTKVVNSEKEGDAPVVENVKDSFTSKLEAGLDAGIPVLLGGPTSYGKTYRVKDYAEKYGYEVVAIPLSMKDRTQIRGIPDPVDITETVFGKLSDVNLMGGTQADPDAGARFADFTEDLIAEADKKGVPKETTDNIPDSMLIGTFQRIKTGLQQASVKSNRIILFFDEVNRVSDPSILSAVFEAVSDKRILGFSWAEPEVHTHHEKSNPSNLLLKHIGIKEETVKIGDYALDEDFFLVKVQDEDNPTLPHKLRVDWDTDVPDEPVDISYEYEIQFEVRIVAAANLGRNYRGTQELDPAFAARFAMVVKSKFDQDDVDGYRRYVASLPDEKMHPLIKRFISEIDDKTLLNAMAFAGEVDENTGQPNSSILEACPTTRSIENLSRSLMAQAANRQDICGQVYFSKLPDILTERPEIPRNWIGYDDNATVSERGRKFTGKELEDLLFRIWDDTDLDDTQKDLSISHVLNLCRALEGQAENSRNFAIEMQIGKRTKFARKFFKFYSENVGSSVLTIPDLKSDELVKEYVYQVLKSSKKGVLSDDRNGRLMQIVVDMYEYQKTAGVNFSNVDGKNLWWALFETFSKMGKGGVQVLTTDALAEVLIIGSQTHPAAFVTALNGLGNRDDQLRFYTSIMGLVADNETEELFKTVA